MTHGRLLVVALLVTTGATLTAQTYRWIPGLDFTTPIYQVLDPKGGPGPLVNRFGYDRDTGTATVLYVLDACYEAWQAWPVPGHGAVIDAVQFAPRAFALVHEDGYLKLEHQPVSAWCTPVAR